MEEAISNFISSFPRVGTDCAIRRRNKSLFSASADKYIAPRKPEFFLIRKNYSLSRSPQKIKIKAEIIPKLSFHISYFKKRESQRILK